MNRRPARDPEPGDFAGLDTRRLRAELTARVDGEVRFDAGSRGAYATDASNYRQVPIGVVVPHTVEAGAEAVAVCREQGAPVLSRGGGTSLAGQCTNVAVGLLPARRPRISARKVKCPMSRYGAKPNDDRPLTSRSLTHLDITVLAASEQPACLPAHPTDTGRRAQVFRLLTDFPSRDWTPAQVAGALRIEHLRSLAAQMGQWLAQQFLVRTGQGRYRLHPQWSQDPGQPADLTDSTTALAA
ncbi:hypothetical protein GCM10022245_17690 [Streptomyces mayteni]